MPQNYTPEFKKKDVLTKASQQNMVYPKLSSLHGVNNSAKNAK